MSSSHEINRRTMMGLAGGAFALAAMGDLTACTSSGETSSIPQGASGGTNLRESPVLTAQVKSGKLPSLKKRLPGKPMIQELWKGPGQYGGTIRLAQTTATDDQVLNMYAPYGLMEWNLRSDKAVPSLAESYTKSDDNKVYTFTLREGLRWSDGEPLTVDDVIFAVKDVLQNKTLYPSALTWLRNVDGTDPKVEKRGRSVVITFANSFALFERYVVMPFQNHEMIKPQHYLKQFHPDYADKETLHKAIKKAGFDTWDQLFADRDSRWLNKDRPVAGAFVVTSPADGQSGTAEMVRNPFYYKTDSDGRQLPYIDKLQIQVLEEQTLNLRAANGDLDLQGRWLDFGTTQLLQTNAESRGFKVARWQTASTLMNLFMNMSHKDPAIAHLFQQIDFRAALSHAIDRKALNQQLLGGIGTYRQFAPSSNDVYYVDGIGKRFLEFDVDTANKLLDGLGLDKKNGDGIRLRSDGKPLDFVVTYVDTKVAVPYTDALKFVTQAWQAIGIKLSLKTVDGTLYYDLLQANNYDIIVYTGHAFDWDMEPIWFTPTSWEFRAASAWASSLGTGGKLGTKPNQEIKHLYDLWSKLATAPTDKERIGFGRQIAKQWDEKVYVLGLLDVPFKPVVVSNKLQNVRDDKSMIFVYFHGFDGIVKPEQLYFTA